VGFRNNMTPKKIRTGDGAPEDTEPWTGDQWRYATVAAQAGGETLLNRLNEMGQRGWEAFSQDTIGAMAYVLMKRRVQ